jgi:hypothetical protein
VTLRIGGTSGKNSRSVRERHELRARTRAEFAVQDSNVRVDTGFAQPHDGRDLFALQPIGQSLNNRNLFRRNYDPHAFPHRANVARRQRERAAMNPNSRMVRRSSDQRGRSN